jgi:hypothetical protein
MPEDWNRKDTISGRMLAAIAAVFVLALVILASGPWNTRHVESNPGPSGTPGSTAINGSPPPAADPSGNTVGAAR